MRRHRPAPRGTLSTAPGGRLSRRSALCGLAGLAAVPLVGCDSRPQKTSARFAQFGTLVDISIWDLPQREAERAISILQRDYAVLNRDWYAWGDGELGQLNRSLRRAVEAPVSAPLGELLQHGLRLSAASRGLFDMRIGPLVELWGFASAASMAESTPAPGDDAIRAALDRARLHVDVLHDGTGWRVRAEAAGVLLDLGGIAKGDILARGMARLESEGVSRALIDAGGDVAVMDHLGTGPFRVGIRPAREGEAVRLLELQHGETVTTSGDYARYREIGGRRYAHIIDPRTGRPSEEARSATVVHQVGARADAAATALIVGGAPEFDAVCDAMRVETALLVDNQGQMRATPEMRVRLETI
ncbi:MAG: FAD:protein FMN transferase [Pseudomonadota bacterium]